MNPPTGGVHCAQRITAHHAPTTTHQSNHQTIKQLKNHQAPVVSPLNEVYSHFY
jgi:hypothetical protein